MSENLVHEYSSESNQRELSTECQNDRVKAVIKNLYFFVLWTQVDSVLEGIRTHQHRKLNMLGEGAF